MAHKKKVAIIGAGASGLICAYEISKVGLDFTLFEQRDCIGGTWAEQPLEVIPDLRSGLSHIYSPTYSSLRTNLPATLMALPDFSFPAKFPTYPTHNELLEQLNRFAEQKNLLDQIAFNHQMTGLERTNHSDKPWKVITTPTNYDMFDSVVFCSSRYQQPIYPDIEKLEAFSGKLEHSISYRKPEFYRNQRVAVLGTGPSGEELSREISPYASRVFVCARKKSRSFLPEEEGLYGAGNNISRHGSIVACEGRKLVLEQREGNVIKEIDTLILCTGYRVSDTLLSSLPESHLSGNGLSVAPLYLNTFHPLYPELSVSGMAQASIPFFSVSVPSQADHRVSDRKHNFANHKTTTLCRAAT